MKKILLLTFLGALFMGVNAQFEQESSSNTWNTTGNAGMYILTNCECVCNSDMLGPCGSCNANNIIVYFNTEKPFCNSGSVSLTQSISGASAPIVAEHTHYVLLELSKRPRATFRPYFAGWDRNENQSAGGVSIYCRITGEKRISTFDMTPQTSDCYQYDASNYYKINWIATENGHGYGASLGSPLFNAQKRIIGQFHRQGNKCKSYECKDPGKHSSNYGKLFRSWEVDKRLQGRLDPNETGVSVWDGIDACPALNLVFNWNISSGSFIYKAAHTIESTGVIQQGADVTYIAGNSISLKPGFQAQEGSQFQARIENFNCVELPDGINLVAWTNIACIDEGLTFELTGATHYSVKIFTYLTGSLVYSGSGNVVGNTVTVWPVYGVSSGRYSAYITFSSPDDEISNSYNIYVQHCRSLTPVNDPGNADSENFDHEIYYSVAEVSHHKFDFTVYPNPNIGNFTIEIVHAKEMKPFSIQIFNSSGKLISGIEHCNAHKINVNHSNLLTGVYFVKLSMGNHIATKKIIIE
ncbi:MAG: T9SS type A sorting domain-containing protein [Lentimicrobiaceae bacterium]|nr:T9SS type A sorting domain-containing protein [Lentimicrobiaceae bacterium]